MKRVIRCLGCGRVKRLYGSYSVKLKEHTKNPLTGEVKEVEYSGRICKGCAFGAGYQYRSLKDRFGAKKEVDTVEHEEA